jgi:rhodanese-related sulfurtransferase
VFKNSTQPETSISPAELQRLAQSGPIEILDVRTPAEFAAAHVPGATLVPLDSLEAGAFLRQRASDCTYIYILCQTGIRARKAIEKFHRAGFDGCILVEGGTQAWMDAGLPVIRKSNKTMPLIQQVQITVGVISAAGAAFALAIDPRFAVIPLLMGCGLLFAGFTGTCGLALLLAKMPWNRVRDGGSRSCCVPNK